MTTDLDTVPFGKYRGRPVIDLLADRAYCEWLAAQPWFREKFVNVYNVILGTGSEPQDTPEHNAMQARYLNHNEALRLIQRWTKTSDALHETWTRGYGRHLTERQRDNLAVDVHSPRIDSLRFEHGGWDLVVRASRVLVAEELDYAHECTCACTTACARPMRHWENYPPESGIAGGRYVEIELDLTTPLPDWSSCYDRSKSNRWKHCADDCPADWIKEREHTRYAQSLGAHAADVTVAVELKPVVGDDYPSVLRQVLKRLDAGRGGNHNVVLADQVDFSTVTLDQVQRIFSSQGVTTLMAQLTRRAPGVAVSVR